VDFTLDETQQAVADLAGTVLRSEADHARLEQVLGSESGYDETLWKAVAQAGLLSLALPESLGGDGLGAVEVATVLTEVGRQTLPIPALATLALGVLPLVAFGNEDAQRALLPEVADGRVLTGALRDAIGTAATATRVGDALVVTATKVGVPYALQAHRVLVATDAGVVLVDPHGDGVTLTRTPTATGAPEYTLRLDGVRVPGAIGDSAVLSRHAVAGAAAVADGVVSGALALTAEHVRARQQFGKPLATFQGVAMQAADVYVTARTMHLASASVNWRLAAHLDADDDLDIAAFWLATELLPAMQTCHHLHGGLGVDVTYPLHRYYSHAKDLARFVGGAESRLDLIGARCSSN
jgi:alkylation response protein AidB-like acyl-CoA dehydrogenase